MPSRMSAVFRLTVDEGLMRDFADAAHREQKTASDVMRDLMETFARESFRKEAERQSHLVAAAPDHEETMAEIERLSAWMHEPDAN